MSYEKKKLAGVLGNNHLGNYPYPPPPNTLMDQEHPQDVYPMRMNPMQYPMNMQPPQPQPPPPPPHPADQCLSTPQSSDMVDDGGCMVPVPQVVMDDHMPEPADNLNMEDNFQNTENNITPANMDLPIQAEVVMEGPDNDDEQQQDNDENNLEKQQIPPKKHCFVCNTQLPQDIETAVPFFKTETTKTNKKFSAVVSRLVGRSITPRKAHSEIICRRCFNLLDRIDTLEVELRESKEEIVSMYKTTLEQYGGKTRRRRTVVSRKSAYLYRNIEPVVPAVPRKRKPKVTKPPKQKRVKPEITDPILSQAELIAQQAVEQSTSCASLMDDDSDDDKKMESDTEGGSGGKKKRKRKFKETHLTPYQRATIVNLKRVGWSLEKISKFLEFKLETTRIVWEQYLEEGVIKVKWGKSFKKTWITNPEEEANKNNRATTKEEDDAIVCILQDNPRRTARSLKAELGLAASEKTIRNRIKELRLKGIIPTPPTGQGKSKTPKASGSGGFEAEYAKMMKKKPPKKPANKKQPFVQPVQEMASPEPTFYNVPPTSHTSNIYKDMRNDAFKINNESHFQRDNNKPPPMPPYYNQNMGMSPFYQHFLH